VVRQPGTTVGDESVIDWPTDAFDIADYDIFEKAMSMRD